KKPLRGKDQREAASRKGPSRTVNKQLRRRTGKKRQQAASLEGTVRRGLPRRGVNPGVRLVSTPSTTWTLCPGRRRGRRGNEPRARVTANRSGRRRCRQMGNPNAVSANKLGREVGISRWSLSQ